MIVVTGGAGFIGSNLVAALEAQGRRDIVVVDRLGSGDKWRNLRKREVRGIVPPEELFRFLEGAQGEVEFVFHLGGVSSTTETDADLVLSTNLGLSQGLWNWCAQSRVRLLYASSAATYGDGSAGFDDEATSAALGRLLPLNLYGWSKHLFDRWAVRRVEAGAAVPPQWAGLKFFNVYGPNEYHKGAQSPVPSLFAKAATGEPAVLFRSHHRDYPDGGQRRDFVFVDDAVGMMMWLFEHPEVCGIFNAGSGAARSWHELAAAVFRALGKPPAITYVDTPQALRASYQYFTEARMQRLAAAGCPLAPTPLEEGVARYVEGFLSRPDRYR